MNRQTASAPPFSQTIGSPWANSEVRNVLPRTRPDALRPGRGAVGCWEGPWPKLIAGRPSCGSGPDDLGHGVDGKRHGEQHEGGQEEHAVMGAVADRLGQFHGDVGRQRAEAVEDVDVQDRGVAGGHQDDHGFADGPPQADHDRGKQAAHGRRDDDARRPFARASPRSPATPSGDVRGRPTGRPRRWCK